MNALDKVLSALPENCCVIAIDGRCAAGKTTLAGNLAKVTGGAVIHMDDFFLPPSLRSEERYSTPGGNVHWERFLEEVIPYLRSGRAFSYRKFSCSTLCYDPLPVSVPPSYPLIVEGAYSLSPVFGTYYDFSVFMDIDAASQEKRIRHRNGDEKAEVFLSRWIPLENAYIDAYGINRHASLTLCGCQE